MKKIQTLLLNIDSTPKLIFFCSILVVIGLIGSLTIDMYVPSMPTIANEFSVTSVAVKYTLGIYLLSYGSIQLFMGPMADCFGRRNILMIAVLVGLAGSAICFRASSIDYLYLGRFLQGAGYAVIGVTAPSMARDVLSTKQFAQVGSILSLFFGLGPILSPIIGSYIDFYLGWRTIFLVICFYTVLILLIAIFILPETLSKENRRTLHPIGVLKNYGMILTNAIFLKNTLSKSVAFMGFMVFYTVTPFMFQTYLGLTSVQYGWITLGVTGVILLAKLINTVLLSYNSLDKIIRISIYFLLIAGFLLFAFALFRQYSVLAIMLPFLIFAFGSGFLFSNATVAAYGPFDKSLAGSVSGLINGTQLLTGFLGSALAAHLDLRILMPLGIFMAIIGILVVAQYHIFDQRSKISH